MTVLGGIDTSSDRAVFQQIADQIRQLISLGELAPGDRVPSEAELMRHYGVARMTVREALGVIKAEGLVVAEHGRGVFVRSRPRVRRLGSDRFSRRHRQQGRAAFFAEADAAGQRPEVDSVVIARQQPPAEVAAMLGTRKNQKVLTRSRRYLINGQPVETAISYIPLDIADGTAIGERDTGPGGIYARMEDQGYVFGPFHEDITARMPTPDETRVLQLSPGIPVFALTRQATETGGRVLEVCETVMAADSFVLSYDLPAR